VCWALIKFNIYAHLGADITSGAKPLGILLGVSTNSKSNLVHQSVGFQKLYPLHRINRSSAKAESASLHANSPQVKMFTEGAKTLPNSVFTQGHKPTHRGDTQAQQQGNGSVITEHTNVLAG
jgi:hypothetical protein